ncbi:calcium-binding protein [Thaumasiovibrio subtropicus]|uniref:calcium-binding protein n=1 Tax=Thaumasiovibrio subtropicus TaxID=1891207 RepID=UPI000B34E97A|nr:hypothetical protein [Thaumasiovibrio subtropicus]
MAAEDIKGTNQDDQLTGTSQGEFIHGYDGDDIINAGGGNDEIHGGKGDDDIRAGRGDDFIATGRGSDEVRGGAGNDIIEAWNHTLDAGDEPGEFDNSLGIAKQKDIEALGGMSCIDDAIAGGRGSDYIEGGAGNDIIYGGGGPQTLGENLFVNGDFENRAATGTVFNPHGHRWATYDEIEGWAATDFDASTDDGLIELQYTRVGGAPTTGANAEPSNTVLELDAHRDPGSEGVSNASVGQAITVESTGKYRFEFDYAGRNRGNQENASETSEFSVIVDGEVIMTFNPENQWSHFEIDLQLDAGTHEIVFQAGGVEDTYGALIDNVSLREVKKDDILIGDNGPDSDLAHSAGNDLMRGGDGDDVMIGDHFDAYSYNENRGEFELDFANGQAAVMPAQNTAGSLPVSVTTGEHSMGAQVAISRPYDGASGDTEIGTWTAYRDGVKVAEGTFTAEDLATGIQPRVSPILDVLGMFEIGPEQTGWKAFDELIFEPAATNTFDVVSVDTISLSGDGNDIMYGGRGDDVVLGGDNQQAGEMIPEFVATEGQFDVNGFQGQMTLAVNGSDAWYNNSLGYYLLDEEGQVMEANVVWSNVKTATDALTLDFDCHDVDQVGLFIVPNGGRLGVGEGAVTLDAETGSLSSNGQTFTALLSEPSHVQNVVNGNQIVLNWNDNTSGDPFPNDYDFNDVQTTVTFDSVSTPQETLYGRKGDDWLDGGAGDDLVVGNRGDDTLIGGTGNDTLKGGLGNDLLVGGNGIDRVYGAKGNDTLVISGDDATTDILHGGKGFDALVSAEFASGLEAEGLNVDMTASNIHRIEAVVGSAASDDSVTLSLDKIAKQSDDVFGLNATDNGTFFVIGVEEVNLDLAGWCAHGENALQANSLDDALLAQLGIDSGDTLYEYTFTDAMSGETVLIYSDETGLFDSGSPM